MNAAEGQGFAVCGGGTGGHIFPALAVAAELQRLAPGRPVIYMGKARGMEEKLVQRAGLRFFGLAAAGLDRRAVWKNAGVLGKAAWSCWQAARILKSAGVGAVLGTGGFVCGPVILAAALRRIPAVIHESNRIPGLTNKLLAKVAGRVAVSWPETKAYFPARKTLVTGFPLRPGLLGPARATGCKTFGLQPGRRVLFIFPGSLAARRINRVVAESLPAFCRRHPKWQVLWMTGSADFGLARRVVEQFTLPVQIREFIHEVPEAYAAADLVLARAGAGTLAELSATGKPSLLVPYPYAANNHQAHNAGQLVKAGAALAVRDADLTPQVLLERLGGMVKDLRAFAAKAAEVKKHYPQKAAARLAEMMIELAEGRESKVESRELADKKAESRKSKVDERRAKVPKGER